MTCHAPSRLSRLRTASLDMLDGFSEDELQRQSHPELSPLLWHVGHVFFVESYWLQERVFGDAATTDVWRELYFPEICAKDRRSARLPNADALRQWAGQVSQCNDRYWARADTVSHPLLEDGYLAAFIRQHYAQHLETMRLAAAQLRLARTDAIPATFDAAEPDRRTRAVVGHAVTLGTDSIEAYDNEQPRPTIEVRDFEIGAQPVTNAEWLGFMAAGGYHTQEYWDPGGWHWRESESISHPQHWRSQGSHWQVLADDDGPVGEQPVHGIGWYEARAYARYANARLPRETEWEAAHRAAALDGCHQVWEWCEDAFYPYPGFRAFPYTGYSLQWFDGQHFVARGASCYTEPEVRRPGFRNFYPPTHRHVLAGLRLAW